MDMNKNQQAPGPASTTEEKLPIGYVDDAQIAAWKTQHKLKRIPEVWTVDDDGVDHVTYFKKPEMEDLQLVADYAKKNDEVKGMTIMFNTLRIGGSPEVIEDTDMKLQCFDGLGKIFKKKESIVKKR